MAFPNQNANFQPSHTPLAPLQPTQLLFKTPQKMTNVNPTADQLKYAGGIPGYFKGSDQADPKVVQQPFFPNRQPVAAHTPGEMLYDPSQDPAAQAARTDALRTPLPTASTIPTDAIAPEPPTPALPAGDYGVQAEKDRMARVDMENARNEQMRQQAMQEHRDFQNEEMRSGALKNLKQAQDQMGIQHLGSGSINDFNGAQLFLDNNLSQMNAVLQAEEARKNLGVEQGDINTNRAMQGQRFGAEAALAGHKYQADQTNDWHKEQALQQNDWRKYQSDQQAEAKITAAQLAKESALGNYATKQLEMKQRNDEHMRETLGKMINDPKGYDNFKQQFGEGATPEMYAEYLHHVVGGNIPVPKFGPDATTGNLFSRKTVRGPLQGFTPRPGPNSRPDLSQFNK